MNTGLTISLDQIPGEEFLLKLLQVPLTFSINGKIIKKGKLLLFRRYHYCLQLTIATAKKANEHFDIPIPFRVENHLEDGLLYFDYRDCNITKLKPEPKTTKSQFFNNILEISLSEPA